MFNVINRYAITWICHWGTLETITSLCCSGSIKLLPERDLKIILRLCSRQMKNERGKRCYFPFALNMHEAVVVVFFCFYFFKF